VKSWFKEWTFRDYTGAAIASALSIILGIFVKVVLGIVINKIPVLSSFLLAAVQTVVLLLFMVRCSKNGFLTAASLIMGSVYGFVFPGHPFLFLTYLFSGLLSDILGSMFGGYGKTRSAMAAVVTFKVLVIISGAVFAWWMGFSKTDLAWALVLLNAAGSAAGAVSGLFLATRFLSELEKTGFVSIRQF